MKHLLTLLAALLLAPLATLHADEPSPEKLAPTRVAGTFHFQPPDSFFGDPIPFHHAGVHHVFYLHSKETMSWYHLASRDLVHWEELPPAILADEEDRMIATGSIVEKDGVFHAFYSTRQHC